MNNKNIIIVVAVVVLAGGLFAITRSCEKGPQQQAGQAPEDRPDYSGITVPRVVKLIGRPGKGQSVVESGSAVEVKYGSWVYDPKKPANRGRAISPSPETVETLKVGSGNAIKGFEEGLLGAKVGETRTLIIPPGSAYGEQGLPPNVFPGAIVLIELEVLAINK